MSLSEFSLNGKKALVIGARRNMGKGFALGLAEAGADVAVTDVNIESGQLEKVSKQIQDMGRDSMYLKVDISSQDEVKTMVRQVEDKFGRIDILMNVAVMYHMNSVQDLDTESWDKLTDVNLKGYWLTIQEVAPLMKKQGSGSIINLTSRGGLKAHADKAMGNYAIVKSGIAMMTRQYSRYLGPYNIRVNAIAPSLVEWEEFPGQENKNHRKTDRQFKKKFRNRKNLKLGQLDLKIFLLGEQLLLMKWLMQLFF